MELLEARWGGHAERRRHARSHVDWPVSAGTSSEHVLPPAELVDVAATGILLSFAQPIGAPADGRVCISLLTPLGRLHRLGRVVRIARGIDHRSYLAVEFDASEDDETDLATLLDLETGDESGPTTGGLGGGLAA